MIESSILSWPVRGRRSITVIEGKGNGQFGAALSNTTLAEAPGEMALGDLNGDGKLDVAVTSHDSYGVMLLTGDGKGGLAIAPTSPIVMKVGQHPHTHGLAVADINRDNKLDLITCNNSDNDISLALGDGRGNFTRAPQSFPVGPSPYPFAAGDVNNDGWLDIVATATATGPSRREQLPLSRALTLLLSDGKGGFAPHQLPLRTGEPWFAAIADLNGDGKAGHRRNSSRTKCIDCDDWRWSWRVYRSERISIRLWSFSLSVNHRRCGSRWHDGCRCD